MKFTKAKAWASAIGLLATASIEALADNVWDFSDTNKVLATVITAALSVYAVYKVENKPIDPR